jgi:DNA gyrase subunit A
MMVDDESDLMFITDRGKLLRTKVSNIRAIGRNTQGVRMMVLEDGELIVSVAKLAEKEETDEPGSVEEAIETTDSGPTADEE